MAKSSAYGLLFRESAVETLFSLSPRRRRKALDALKVIARHPGLKSDFSLLDADGREQHHLLSDDVMFTYWFDHADRSINVIEIEDVRADGP